MHWGHSAIVYAQCTAYGKKHGLQSLPFTGGRWLPDSKKVASLTHDKHRWRWRRETWRTESNARFEFEFRTFSQRRPGRRYLRRSRNSKRTWTAGLEVPSPSLLQIVGGVGLGGGRSDVSRRNRTRSFRSRLVLCWHQHSELLPLGRERKPPAEHAQS